MGKGFKYPKSFGYLYDKNPRTRGIKRVYKLKSTKVTKADLKKYEQLVSMSSGKKVRGKERSGVPRDYNKQQNKVLAAANRQRAPKANVVRARWITGKRKRRIGIEFKNYKGLIAFEDFLGRLSSPELVAAVGSDLTYYACELTLREVQQSYRRGAPGTRMPSTIGSYNYPARKYGKKVWSDSNPRGWRSGQLANSLGVYQGDEAHSHICTTDSKAIYKADPADARRGAGLALRVAKQLENPKPFTITVTEKMMVYLEALGEHQPDNYKSTGQNKLKVGEQWVIQPRPVPIWRPVLAKWGRVIPGMLNKRWKSHMAMLKHKSRIGADISDGAKIGLPRDRRSKSQTEVLFLQYMRRMHPKKYGMRKFGASITGSVRSQASRFGSK